MDFGRGQEERREARNERRQKQLKSINQPNVCTLIGPNCPETEKISRILVTRRRSSPRTARHIRTSEGE